MSEISVFPATIPAAPAVAPDMPYARDELLHEILAATAARDPLAPALRLTDPNPEIPRRSTLTYGELRQRATRFAHFLRGRGVGRGDNVLICLPRGLDQYLALLGVLEAGAAYVPMDWSVPQDRADYVCGDAAIALVVTQEERAAAFRATGVAVLDMDAELGDIAASPDMPLTREETGAEPSDLAYIIYTSGSTGQPKGVAIRHSNICHLIRAEGAILALWATDKVFGGFSLAFDMSVETMWSAFLPGAELLVGSEALNHAVSDLPQVLEQQGATVWHATPSLLAVVDAPLRAIRLINLGGEACPPELVRRWAALDRRLLNTYGPTETTVTATWAELHPGEPVTIGHPLPGYTAWIVDEALRPVPPGAEGELVIGGPGVGAGYLNLPEQNAARFVPLPFLETTDLVYRTGDLVRLDEAGRIEYLGRIDTQVKIRGFRVELGEIEGLLGTDPAVAQAVVNLFQEADGTGLLAAFVSPRAGANIDLPRLRALVRERLPAYMRPAAYEVRDGLPTLISGKVDRKALAKPHRLDAPGRALAAPETEAEERLLRVWSTVFAPTEVSVLDDFFEDLGGHSLRAARMVSLARAEPGLERLSIQDLYAAPSIRQLAARIESGAASKRHKAAPQQPFAPVPPWRHALCGTAQLLALLPIYAFAGMQWLLPYLAYTAWDAWYDSRLQGIAVAALCFVLLPPVLILVSIGVKWLVLGRVKPGDYPLWGTYYFRWWLVRRMLSVIPTRYLAGTPMMRVYYRLLGARIGRDAYLGLPQIDAPDLVSIGEGAIVSEGAVLATTSVEHGLLRIGTATVGKNAFLGVMSVVGRNASLGDGAALEDLSALPTGEHIPTGERWSGSPAEPLGRHEPQPPPPVTRLRRVLVTVGLLLSAPLLPLAVVLPIMPGVVAMVEWQDASTSHSYLAAAPFLAMLYVVLMCALTVMAKWLLLGRVRPGTRSIWSWFYVRYWFVRQLGELALEMLHPIYATLYVLPWYRAMGAKVGARAEISTATAVIHDLISIGPESFIADGVVFGAARLEPGMVRLAHTRIGHRSFIGNSGLLPTGAAVGDDVLIGVLSKPPEEPGRALEAGTTWFGSPALRLPRRQSFALFDEGSRFRPARRLVLMRLAIEFVRVILSTTISIALFVLMLDFASNLLDEDGGGLTLALAFPFLYLGMALAAGVFVLALKWLVVGRYRPTTAPLWSPFVWRSELVTSTYENLVVPLLLFPLRGTPFINIYLRLLGARIGRRVFTDTTDMTEFDMVSVGDDAALNEDAGLQTHLFEDRVMKVSSLEVGPRATVGSLAIVLYDSKLEAEAQLGDLSVLMKGETLPASTSWEGSPARPARA
jgi:non-ribosomal peptide synthetase-like protein